MQLKHIKCKKQRLWCGRMFYPRKETSVPFICVLYNKDTTCGPSFWEADAGASEVQSILSYITNSRPASFTEGWEDNNVVCAVPARQAGRPAYGSPAPTSKPDLVIHACDPSSCGAGAQADSTALGSLRNLVSKDKVESNTEDDKNSPYPVHLNAHARTHTSMHKCTKR